MIKKSSVLLAAGALLALLSSCGDNVVENYNSPINPEATLNVVVRDLCTGEPVNGAQVTLLTVGATASTASTGVATFKNVYVGTHKVKIEKEGYASVVHNAVIKRDDKDADQSTYIANETSTEFNIYPLTSSIDGYIYYSKDGKSIAAGGANVRVMLNDNAIIDRIFDVTVDDKGFFVFRNLPAIGIVYTLFGLEYTAQGKTYKASDFGAPAPLVTGAPAHVTTKLEYTTDITPFIYLGSSPITVEPKDSIVLTFSDDIDVAKIANIPLTIDPSQAVELKYSGNTITLTPKEEWSVPVGSSNFWIEFIPGALVSVKGTSFSPNATTFVRVNVLLKDISSRTIEKLELDTLKGNIPTWTSTYASFRWKKIDGATSYKIFAKKYAASDYVYITEVNGDIPRIDGDTVFAAGIPLMDRYASQQITNNENVFVVQGFNARSQTKLDGAGTLTVFSRPTVKGTSYLDNVSGLTDPTVRFSVSNDDNYISADQFYNYYLSSYISQTPTANAFATFYVTFTEEMDKTIALTSTQVADFTDKTDIDRITVTPTWHTNSDGTESSKTLKFEVSIKTGVPISVTGSAYRIYRIRGLKSKNGKEFFVEYTNKDPKQIKGTLDFAFKFR